MVRRRQQVLSISVVAMVTALIASMASFAQESPDPAKPVALTGYTLHDGWTDGRDQLLQVFIRLDLPSVAEYVSVTGAGPEGQRAHAREVLAQQERVREALDSLMERELSSLVVGINGFRAIVRAEDIPAIQETPGVESVTAVSLFSPSSLPQATERPIEPGANFDATGEGVRVAVIDTGIDYTHQVFQAPGPDRRPHFVDVGPDHTFEADIAWLAVQGITHGCDPAQTRFCPDQPVTRAQMAAFLARALDLPAASASPFLDDDDSPFEDDIARLAAAGITSGCNPPENDRFCPDRPLTRGEMATLLVRAFEIDPSPVTHFTDVEGTHAEAASALAEAGISRGCDPRASSFCPERPLTRGEMAALLRRTFQHSGLASRTVPDPYDGAVAYSDNLPDRVEGDTFPTGRVTAGLDLAGTAYDVSDPDRRDHSPDPDPLDVAGHGTLAASLISGTTGIAPDAEIMALKVTDDAGSPTDLVADAIERALDPNGDLSIDDAVDVIHLGLTPDVARPGDPAATALSAASAAGVVVVTAGDAAADGAISVIGSGTPGLQVDSPNFTAILPTLVSQVGTSTVTGPLVSPVPRDACTPVTGDLTGAIALVQRGTCRLTDKIANAATAGAIGVVVVDAEGGGPDVTAVPEPTIPYVLVDHDSGQRLAEAETATVTLSPGLTPEWTASPRPDLSATELDLAVGDGPSAGAAAGTGSGWSLAIGDSAASAQVAGAAALLLETQPSYTPERVKATLNLTAAVPTAGGLPGILDPAAALGATVSATPAVLDLQVEGDDPVTATLRVQSQSDLQVHVEGVDDATGFELRVPEVVEVQEEMTDLEIEVVPVAGKEQADRHRVWIHLTDGAENTIRVPVLVDLTSRMHSAIEARDGQLENPGVADGRAEPFEFLTETDGLAIGYRPVGDQGLQFGLSLPTSFSGVTEAAFLVDSDRDGVDDVALIATDHGKLRGGPPNGELATAVIDLETGGGPAGYLSAAAVGDRFAILQVDVLGERGFLADEHPFDVTPVVIGDDGTIRVGQTETIDLDTATAGEGVVVAAGDTVDIDSGRPQLWLFLDNPAEAQSTVVRD